MKIKGLEAKVYHREYYQKNIDKWRVDYKVQGKYIYFLLKDDVVNYCGSSSNLYVRINVHKSTHKETFDTIVWFDLSNENITKEQLLDLEYWWQGNLNHLEDCSKMQQKNEVDLDIFKDKEFNICALEDFNKKLFK